MQVLRTALLSTLGICFLLQSCALDQGRRPYRPMISKKKTSEFSPIRKKIAILPFVNEAPIGGRDLSIIATEEFRREISYAQDFILDPEGERIFGNSQDIYAGGGVKLTQLARKAKMSGINIVIFGRITQARVRQRADEIGFVRKVKSMAESNIELKVFDVQANKELYSEVLDGNISDENLKFYQANPQDSIAYRQELLRYSVQVASRKFVPKVIKVAAKLDWMGRVAKIIGTRIYINAGRSAGINIGDILKVVTEGQEIYDPATGAIIGLSEGEVKGTLEVVDYLSDEGSVCILHSGGSVTEGDFVQLY